MVNWETETFSPPVLAVLVFASVALFPTLLLPSSPSMWMAGMTFGYVYGLLLIVPAVAVGVSLPFFIGSFFHHKIEVCALSSVEVGFCLHVFASPVLIRIQHFMTLCRSG